MRGNLAVIVMAGQVAVKFHHAEARYPRSVVAEHLKRVAFNCVKPGFAGFNLAFVRVRLTDFKLETTALKVLVETFVGGHLGSPCSVSMGKHYAETFSKSTELFSLTEHPWRVLWAHENSIRHHHIPGRSPSGR
ncbi:hypothetical protein CCP3SC1AL1_470004 [Gammaproteobacteria bacterium]